MRIILSEIKEKTGIGFGTSGIRGLVTDLSDEVVYQYCRAFLEYCKSKFEFSKIAIAGDLRDSTERIMRVTCLLAKEMEIEAINCGKIPTPALALFAQSLKIPAIMVTGSHIPADRNGVKFYLPTGEVLKSDETIISNSEIEFVKKDNYQDELPPENTQARKLYIDRYKKMFKKDFFENRKIGVYGHSAVGRDILVEILENLGASVTKIDYSDIFIPIDTEVIEEDLEKKGKEWILKYKLEAIVSTDGDSDRPLVSDKNGVWYRSDILGIYTAKKLGYKKVVCPISCNTMVDRCDFFNHVYKTKIGSPYVIEEMRKQGDEVCGYEANGGFFAADLQTRDAMLPILVTLSEDSVNISRHTYSNSIKGVETKKSLESISDLEKIRKDLETEFGEIVDVNQLDGLRLKFANQEIVHFRPSKNAPEFRFYSEADSQIRAKELTKKAGKLVMSWII